MSDLSYKRFFRTLGNTTRLELIFALRDGEMNVGELADATGFQQSTVSHNLKRLVCCRFVYMRKDGRHRYYRLNNQTIEPLLKLMNKHVQTFCKTACYEK